MKLLLILLLLPVVQIPLLLAVFHQWCRMNAAYDKKEEEEMRRLTDEENRSA